MSPFHSIRCDLMKWFYDRLRLCPSLEPYKNKALITQETHTLIWTCTKSSYDVHPQSSCPWVDWWTLLFCVSNLIVLCILFLRASFTSNTSWESHHNENSPVLYLGSFSKSFGRESRLFKQICIHYTNHICRWYQSILFSQ